MEKKLGVLLHSLYIQLLLINLVFLIGKVWLTFSPDWPELCLIWAEQGQNGGKRSFQESGVVLYSFYVQLLQINLFLILIEKLDQKSKLSAPIGLYYAI